MKVKVNVSQISQILNNTHEGLGLGLGLGLTLTLTLRLGLTITLTLTTVVRSLRQLKFEPKIKSINPYNSTLYIPIYCLIKKSIIES